MTRRCSADKDMKRLMVKKLGKRRHEGAASAAVIQPREMRARDDLSDTTDSDQTTEAPFSRTTGAGASPKRGLEIWTPSIPLLARRAKSAAQSSAQG